MRRGCPITHVCVVYDGEVGGITALNTAARLAGERKGRLTIVALPENRTRQTQQGAEARRRLERLVPGLKAEGVATVDIIVLLDGPTLDPRDAEIACTADLLVLNKRLRPRLLDRFVRPQPWRLADQAECPILLAGSNGENGYRRVLVALPGPADNGELALQEQLIQCGVELASGAGAEVHVIHAWDVTGNERDMIASELPDETRHAILGRHRREHEDWLAGAIKSFAGGGLELKVHAPRASPLKAILELAETLRTDLVIAGQPRCRLTSPQFMGTSLPSLLHRHLSADLLVVKSRITQAGRPAKAEFAAAD